MYAAPVSTKPLNVQTYRRKLSSINRLNALSIASTFRTTSSSEWYPLISWLRKSEDYKAGYPTVTIMPRIDNGGKGYAQSGRGKNVGIILTGEGRRTG